MRDLIKLHFIETKSWSKIRFLLLIFLLLNSSVELSAHINSEIDVQTVDVYETIMGRIQTAHKSVNVSTMESNTKYYLSILNEEGAFTNVDYADRSQTNWKPIAHLDRMKSMVLAYTMTNSKYYGDEEVYHMLVKMLNYWYDKHPTSTNWFNQQIACPQRMGVMLILMRSGATQLPTELESKLLERMKTEGGRPDASGSQGTGANKLDIATHWVYRGCLTKDDAVLSFGVEQVYYPIFLTIEEGLQHDYAYQQHSNQLYIGGYGYAFINGISSIAEYMVGTTYALSGDRLDMLSKFTRVAYLPVIRGKYFLYNTLGRGLSRKGGLGQSGFATVVNRMISLDPLHTEEYEQAVKRLKGTEPASYGIKATNTHFWRSDYTLHQRVGYTFDVRTASRYTCRNENGNAENLKGYFLTDGATDIAIDGDEYVDIFPVWDWAKIPGVTAPAVTTIPQPAQWGQYGTSTFTGGASDGKYGVSTYWLNDNKYNINTSAKKSWFFFDEEVVCLGAGITSTATQAINTTVNQTLLKGDVVVRSDEDEDILLGGVGTFDKASWVLHNKVGYVFPEGGNLKVGVLSQTGTWKAINTSGSDEQVSLDVFKMWFDHGTKPTKATYSYIVVPNKNTTTEMNAYSGANIEILANTDSVQVVRHKGLNLLSLVFYKAATFTNGNIIIGTDKGCAMIVKNIGSSEVEFYVSDPTRAQSKINLKIQLPSIKGVKGLLCSMATHPDPYAGSTFKYIVNKETSEYVPSPSIEEYIYASADAWVRDGSYADTNYGNNNTLVVKKDGEGYNREAYVKFDLEKIDISKYKNIFLSMYVSNANSSISATQWNISYVSDNTWTEDAITWNNKPVVNNVIETIGTVSTGSNIMVNITQVVLDEIAKGSKQLTLHISSTTKGDGKTDAQFFSKEGSDPTKVPQLALEEKEAVNVESLEVTVEEDAWVRDGSYADTNYGSNNTLVVKKDGEGYAREAYVKFNLKDVSVDVIDKVVLSLVVSNANTSIETTNWQIKPVANTWSEPALTWTNRPTELSEEAIATVVGQPAKSEVKFNITEYLRAEYEKGNKIISLKISASDRGADGKTDAQFFSKEASDETKRPKLVIEYKTLSSVRSIEPDNNELDNNNVSVYPNPVIKGNIIQVEFAEETKTAEIKVVDMAGRTLLITKDHWIDSSKLGNGVYILSIKDDVNPKNNKGLKLIVR